jgi:hypothetical protein
MGAGNLMRKDLVKAMQTLNPRLVVVLTDCCSKVVPPPKFGGAVAPPPKATWPVMDCLFFHHQGVVAINGCQADSFSWCYADKDGGPRGGTFTLALVPLLCSKIKVLAPNDTFVTWDVFSARLKKETDEWFQRTKKELLAADPTNEISKQATQDPEVTLPLATKAQQPIVDPPWLFGTDVGERPGGKVPGVTVTKVYPNTPAAKAGIRTDDVILELGGWPTPTARDFVRAIDYSEVAQVTVVVQRAGQKVSLEAELQAVKAKPAPDQK